MNATHPPSLVDQHASIGALYEEILAHYGTEVGLRHARKHLGWALDAAAAAAGAPPHLLKAQRGRVLTGTDPASVAAASRRGVRRIRQCIGRLARHGGDAA